MKVINNKMRNKYSRLSNIIEVHYLHVVFPDGPCHAFAFSIRGRVRRHCVLDDYQAHWVGKNFRAKRTLTSPLGHRHHVAVSISCQTSNSQAFYYMLLCPVFTAKLKMGKTGIKVYFRIVNPSKRTLLVTAGIQVRLAAFQSNQNRKWG